MERFATLSPERLQVRARDWQPGKVCLVNDPAKEWTKPDDGWPWVSLREWAREHTGTLIQLHTPTGVRYARISTTEHEENDDMPLSREDIAYAVERAIERVVTPQVKELSDAIASLASDIEELGLDLDQISSQGEELDGLLSRMGISVSDLMSGGDQVDDDDYDDDDDRRRRRHRPTGKRGQRRRRRRRRR